MEMDRFTPLSGFRDLLDERKTWLTAELTKIFQEYGYQALETPAIERQEILLGKLGEEGQKQLYFFEDNGKRQVGLRYDLTVPLARFVAANVSRLEWPFKRFEIGPAWRAEKPQKGRYRQFTQADVDIVGAPEPSSERELLALVKTVSERLRLDVVCQLNDRRLVGAVFDALKIPADRRVKLLQLLDKKDKLTDDQFNDQFRQLGLSDVERRQIIALFLTDGDAALTAWAKITDSPAIAELRTLLVAAKKLGLTATFVPSMVRGLDYYTGTIIECAVPGSAVGTVIAGGRYDQLLEPLAGRPLPSVGISFGIDRLIELISPEAISRPLFVVRLPETTGDVDRWAAELRDQGQNVDVFLDETVALGTQIKYADKRGYASILIPFADEWQRGEIVRKFLQSGRQETIARETIK